MVLAAEEGKKSGNKGKKGEVQTGKGGTILW
jgi:hypothetical protein